ncbi:2-amino-4-hydroxy-6-hydroxymethyldihydropteridine diphosphokinase [Cohnella sp. LGH]|uniref:2-amino-4-hydroxy-6- hydroxymethyldihydropteridine diphosphokinase n=1 Tax=Cohnella sp. LGH TaxID=1619153 RepID=UPI001ADADDCE|nr:2-amino-4-hydroxy-6-hydroxymethyldihydropteridine diphosphokinase [Cohnella sp. LGH]QTH43072.1 2-amino-4-hydroxy-6-hydroxymethyldihydropteridine diphosphokinase [Cohnella sp. LGH]
MQDAYVALGANLGDREASLKEAIRRLQSEPELELRRISPVYETAPVGYADQPSFLNMTIGLQTSLGPEELLRRLLAIELEMGRVRNIRNGPRNIDLDLLAYDGVEMDTPELTLPHPRMGQRAFVLVPLKDIWPEEPPFPWEEQLSGMSLREEGISRFEEWEGAESGKEQYKC